MAGQHTISREELIAARIEQIDKQNPESSPESSLWKAREEAVQFKNRSRKERTEPISIGSTDGLDGLDGFGRKFVHRYNGPYKVTQFLGNGTYELAELNGTRLAIKLHGDRLMLCKQREPEQEPFQNDWVAEVERTGGELKPQATRETKTGSRRHTVY